MGRHSNPAVQRRGVRRRLVAGVLALGLVAVAGSGRAASTEANWADAEMGQGSFAAKIVASPSPNGTCKFDPGLLGVGARVIIYWTLPDGYEFTNMKLSASTAGLGSVLAPITGYSLSSNTKQIGTSRNYETSVPTNLLGGLLGLGASMEIAITTVDDPKRPESWTSTPMSVTTNAGLIGGIGGFCKNT